MKFLPKLLFIFLIWIGNMQLYAFEIEKKNPIIHTKIIKKPTKDKNIKHKKYKKIKDKNLKKLRKIIDTMFYQQNIININKIIEYNTKNNKIIEYNTKNFINFRCVVLDYLDASGSNFIIKEDLKQQEENIKFIIKKF